MLTNGLAELPFDCSDLTMLCDILVERSFASCNRVVNFDLIETEYFVRAFSARRNQFTDY